MANKKNKHNNEQLQKLLKKDFSAEQVPDEFELEALEGFAMLKDEQEILQVKEKLDERMAVEVFSGRKKSGRTTYFLAAAALLLLVGFVVFLLMNTEVPKPKELAITQSQKPESQSVVEVPINAAPTAESSKGKAAVAGKTNAHEGMSGPKQTEGSKDLSPKAVGKSAASARTFKVNVEQENEALSGAGTADAGVEKSLGEKEAEPDEKKLQGVIAAAPMASQDMNAHASLPANNGAMSQPIVTKVQVVSAKPSRSKRAEAISKKETATTCYFKGGEKALLNELKEKLAAKNLLKNFDAKLFVNVQGKVDKIVFLNTYELSSSEQRHVMDVLRTLNNFVVELPASNEGYCEYPVHFKP